MDIHMNLPTRPKGLTAQEVKVQHPLHWELLPASRADLAKALIDQVQIQL